MFNPFLRKSYIMVVTNYCPYPDHESKHYICTISDCSRYAVSVCRECKSSPVCLYHRVDCCPNCEEREHQWRAALRKHEVELSKYRQKFPISNCLLSDLVVAIWFMLCLGIGIFIVVRLGISSHETFISCIIGMGLGFIPGLCLTHPP